MHVDLPALIQAYGYPLTFIGSLFEGETIVTLAGLAVHRGHLYWPAVLVLAAAGGTVGDTIYFALGRRYGSDILARWPSFSPAIERVKRLVAEGNFAECAFPFSMSSCRNVLSRIKQSMASR